MTTYYLYRDASQRNRVVLNKELPKGCMLIRTLEAESWVKARLSVNEDEFYYVQGQGYF